MTDVTNQKPLRVLNFGTAGPFVRLPFIQLDDVRRLLDGHGIVHWVDDGVISWNGGPEYALINFGREGDSVLVQAILDQVS